VWIEDADGNVFLDCNAGVAVCSTGHCHPEIVEAITKQAQTLIHMCGTDFYYRQMPDLGEKLNEICPIEGDTKTHFANSGAEAVETALKLAMYHTKRQKFISFFGSFTVARLALVADFIEKSAAFRLCASGIGCCSRSISEVLSLPV
jgi:4-aminobutyrate aminotransferase